MVKVHESRLRGFTLVETIVTLGLVVLVFAISMPISVNFYKSFILQSATETALNSLKKARQDSQVGFQDSSYGVYFDNSNNRFVYFKGANYASRDTAVDQVFPVPGFVTFTGTSEYVFQKLTGDTSVIGETFLTNGLVVNALKVEEKGKISFLKNVSVGQSSQ